VNSPDSARKLLMKTFDYLLEHDGSSHLEVSMKILKRGQKEILIQCGRVYRFVVDDPARCSGDGKDSGMEV